MDHEDITLVLSGTQMSGFRYTVDREWALGVTREEIVSVFRSAMIDLARKHDMYHLLEMAKKIKLDIHSNYNQNSKEIYICVCEVHVPSAPPHAQVCDSQKNTTGKT